MLVALITLIFLYGLKKIGINTQIYDNLQNFADRKFTQVTNKINYKPQQIVKTLPKPKLYKTHPLKIPTTKNLQKPYSGKLKI